MTVTIDHAGRLVIPKAIREEAHLEAGETLEIRVRDGRIEIETSARDVEIVTQGRLRVAKPRERSTALTSATVRATQQRIRERER